MPKELLQQALVNVHDAILRGNSDGELLVMIDDALRDAKAQQEQPAQKPVAWLHGTTFQVVVSKNRPDSLSAWLPLFAAPPTQPALSAAEIHNLFNTLGTKLCLNYEVTPGQSQQIVKAVEAHCRGGAK